MKLVMLMFAALLLAGCSGEDAATERRQAYTDGFIDGYCYAETTNEDPLSDERLECREHMNAALAARGEPGGSY